MKNKMNKTKKVVLYASLIVETKTKLNTGQEIAFGDDSILGVMYVFRSREDAEKIYGKGCPLIQIGMRPQEREKIKKIQNEKMENNIIDIKVKKE